MRFLANENFPRLSIVELRQRGFEVASVSEDSPGAADEDVLAQAEREKFVILTFDRDYGELIFHRRTGNPAGVVYFRFTPRTPSEPGEYLARLSVPYLLYGGKLDGMFTVVDRQQIRQRPLPRLRGLNRPGGEERP